MDMALNMAVKQKRELSEEGKLRYSAFFKITMDVCKLTLVKKVFCLAELN